MQLRDIDWLCRVLNCSRPRAYEILRRGWIPTVRMGRQIRVEEDTVRKFVRRGGQPSAVAPSSSPDGESRMGRG